MLLKDISFSGTGKTCETFPFFLPLFYFSFLELDLFVLIDGRSTLTFSFDVGINVYNFECVFRGYEQNFGDFITINCFLVDMNHVIKLELFFKLVYNFIYE